MDALGVPDKNGHDIDIWGGVPAAPLLLPDPASGAQDCPLKEAGACPADCDECLTFVRSLDPANP
jgi:hypothetical protein